MYIIPVISPICRPFSYCVWFFLRSARATRPSWRPHLLSSLSTGISCSRDIDDAVRCAGRAEPHAANRHRGVPEGWRDYPNPGVPDDPHANNRQRRWATGHDSVDQPPTHVLRVHKLGGCTPLLSYLGGSKRLIIKYGSGGRVGVQLGQGQAVANSVC